MHTQRRWAATLLIALVTTPVIATGNNEDRMTEVSIDGDAFLINGRLTYEGRTWSGQSIEGLLFNARLVQGIFDDLNPATVNRWAYPDTGQWDAERNTLDFVEAMPHWYHHGLLAFTVNLQGGCPYGYCQDQSWHNSALTSQGNLRPDYMDRLELILDQADQLGMVAILGIYYFGQDQRMQNEAAVLNGLDNVVDWIIDHGYRNVLIEINNECNILYDHAILQAHRVHELIQRVQSYSAEQGYRLLVSTSYTGGTVPNENVIRCADFVLLHGNGVQDPNRIAQMVDQTRRVSGYRPMPILFNEDDHYDFDHTYNNMVAATDRYSSWGFFDGGSNNYRDGYQCPPVNWEINTQRKQAFFCNVERITGASSNATRDGDSCCDAVRYDTIAYTAPVTPAGVGCGLGFNLSVLLSSLGLLRLLHGFEARKRCWEVVAPSSMES